MDGRAISGTPPVEVGDRLEAGNRVELLSHLGCELPRCGSAPQV